MRLTDVQVKNAKPRERAYKLSDGGGLYVEIQPGGSKLWRLKYRHLGIERRISFGAYLPNGKGVGLAEAREKCSEAKRLIRDGVDPVHDRRQKRAVAAQEARDTLRAIGGLWLDHAAERKGWTAKYKSDVEKSLDTHIYPRLGDRPIRTITALDLLALLKAKGTQLETVRRLRQRLDAIFSFGVVRRYVDGNPAHDIRGEFNAPVVTHFQTIPESELSTLLAKVADDGNRIVEAAIWLLCLTAVRTGELRGAEWAEFDLDAKAWTIPASRMKKRREHIVPLSSQAIEILRRLRELTGDGRFLFANRNDSTKVMSENTILFVLYRIGYRGRMTGHGFRALFSSSANDHQQPADVVDACLAHVVKDKTERAYNRALLLERRRRVMQWWGDHVDHLTSKSSAKVLQFDRATA